jgi:hypothetical protein
LFLFTVRGLGAGYLEMVIMIEKGRNYTINDIAKRDN